MRENDYFLNAITNPTFTPSDFRTVGLTADNTSFESADTYAKLDFVQQNPIFQTDGKFDEKKFKQYYKAAAEGYQLLSEQDFTTGLANSFSSFRNNVLSARENRINGPEYKIEKKSALNPNPQRQKISAWGYNQLSQPINSDREIAESNKVWDVNTNKWIDSPNDQGFFKNLFDTKVLAQWEFDADVEGNRTNDPSQVVYKKGQYKLNYKGEPYYETLGNRSVYGRQVLSAFDTITTDNSSANKYDFFDSDDIDKSFGGTLVKNIIKVAPAFIPYVGPWYIAARVGLSSADLFAKMGKMTFGSDNELFSAIEGFSKATTMSTSDYGQQHAWGIENLLNMSADVFTQLAEQRWLFKYLPSLLKGNKLGFSEKAQSAFREAEVQSFINSQKNLQQALAASGEIADSEAALNFTGNLFARATSEANAKLAAILKDNYDIGKYISRAYMTGVTVADSYGEAKEAGASDLEAALFTLGYASAEWGILSTNLGEWFLPELRLEKQKIRQLIKGVTGNQPPQNASKEVKENWIKSLINAGKKYFNGEYGYSVKETALGSTATHLFANAIGEGVEEVSEELLQDLSKSLANVAYYMKGSDVNLKPTWISEDGSVNLLNTLNDYALNFVGGFIGGGIGQMHQSYKDARKIKNLSESNSAFQELVYLIKEGKSDEIIKTANKMLLGDPNLSPSLNSDGVFESGTKDTNQNKAAQLEFSKYINNLEKIINMVGAKSQNDLLNDLTLKDIRFSRLLDSKVAASYLQDYNTLVSQTVNMVEQLNAILTDKKTDSSKLTESQEDEANNLRKKIQENQKLIESYHDGTQAKEFIRDAMFEMNLNLANGYLPNNIIQFIMLKEASNGESRKLTEIPQNTLEQYKREWSAFSQTDLKDKIRERRKWFDQINEKVSGTIQQFVQDYVVAGLDVISDYSEQTLGLEGIQTGIITEKNLSKALQQYAAFLETNAKTPQQRDYLFTKLLNSSLNKTIEDDYYVHYIEDVLYSNNPIDETFAEWLLNNENANISNWVRANEYTTAIELLKDLNDSENGNTTRLGLINVMISAFQDDVLSRDNIESIINEIKSAPFIKASIKQYLQDYINRSSLDKETKQNLNNTINQIKSTPFDELLDSFQLVLGDSNIKVSKLLQILETDLESALRSTNLAKYGYKEDLEQAINNTLSLIQILQGHLSAARTDNANYEDPNGYNVSVNELVEGSNLATIDINSYNLLSEDLSKTATELLFYKKLYDLNSKRSVEKESRNHAKIVTSFFRKARQTFTVNIPDSWNGKSELQDIFEDLSHGIITDLIDNPRDLNDKEERIELRKAEVKMADAIYKFFQKNKDRDLSEIFTYESFSDAISVNEGDSVARENDNTFGITTKQFMYYLAAAATLQYADFLNQYKDIIDNQYYPFAGQLNLLYHEQAFSKSTFWFDKMNEAYNKLVDYVLSSEERVTELRNVFPPDIAFMPNSKRNNHISINFDRVFLAEGCPGSGKSTANFAYFLKLNKSRFTKPIFLVAKTKGDADRMIESLSKITGIDKSRFKGFDKNSYLSYINDNYIPPIVTEDGSEVYDKNDVEHFPVQNEEDKTYHFPFESKFNENIESPSVVLIDEVTNFGEQQLFMHNAYMHKLNITSIATGDFKQSTVKGKINDSNVVYTSRNNFPTTVRVAPSVRSNNLINSDDVSIIEIKNNELSQQAIEQSYSTPENFVDPENDGTVLQSENPFSLDYSNLKYSEDEDGFYGIKFSMSSDDLSEDIKSTIQIMLSTLDLDKGESISFVYTKVNTPIYNYLKALNESGEYKNRINFIQGSAQGKEGKYYILDLDNQSEKINVSTSVGENRSGEQEYDIQIDYQDITSYYKDFYTSISRAENGTLVILNGQFDQGEPYSKKVDSPGAFEISPEVRSQANSEMKEIIEKSIEGIELLEQNESNKETERSTENPVTDKEQTGNNSGNVDNDNAFLDQNTDKVNRIVNNEARKTIAPLYSFNTLEIGASFKLQGTDYKFYIDQQTLDLIKSELSKDIKKRDFSKVRIDGVNGLAMIFGINKPSHQGFSVQINESTGEIINVQAVLQNIKQIRYAFKYAIRDVKSGKESSLSVAIKKKLPSIFSDVLDNFNVKYQFKSYVEPSSEGQNKNIPPRFKKGKDEVIIDLLGKVENVEKITPRNKGIVATLSFKDQDGNDQDVFETSIFTFPNYLSMLDSFENIPKKGEGESDFKYLKRLQEEYTKESRKENPDEIIKTNLFSAIRLIEIFMLGSPTVDENFIISGIKQNNIFDLNESDILKLNLTGPMIVGKDKGFDYVRNHAYETAKETSPIAEIFNSLSTFTISKKAYTFIDGLEVGGKMIVEPGHSFILITENPNITNDKQLLREFIQQELNRGENDNFYGIKIAYINSPADSVKTYFQALHNRLTSRNSDEVKQMLDDSTNDSEKYTEKNGSLAYLGNQFTNFRILQQIFSKEDAIQNILKNISREESRKLAEKNLVALKYFIEFLERYQSDKKNFIKILNGKIEDLVRLDKNYFENDRNHSSTQNGDGKFKKFAALGMKKSVGSLLSRNLWKLIFRGGLNINTGEVVNTDAIIDYVSNILSEHNWDGISYHIPLEKDAEEQINIDGISYKVVPLNINSDWQFELTAGEPKPVYMISKVDQTMVIGDINSLLNTIGTNIRVNQKTKKIISDRNILTNIDQVFDNLASEDSDIREQQMDVINNLSEKRLFNLWEKANDAQKEVVEKILSEKILSNNKQSSQSSTTFSVTFDHAHHLSYFTNPEESLLIDFNKKKFSMQKDGILEIIKNYPTSMLYEQIINQYQDSEENLHITEDYTEIIKNIQTYLDDYDDEIRNDRSYKVIIEYLSNLVANFDTLASNNQEELNSILTKLKRGLNNKTDESSKKIKELIDKINIC